MSFGETIFLFVLALLVFGPKKLPEIARQVGRALNEFRKASNEFKAQIEQEIAHLENESKPQILPPSPPPAGTLNRLNPGSTQTVANHAGLSSVSVSAEVAATSTEASASALGAQTPDLSPQAADHRPQTSEPGSPTSPGDSTITASPASQESHV
jgi:sec-independent protein translocase protein TatB